MFVTVHTDTAETSSMLFGRNKDYELELRIGYFLSHAVSRKRSCRQKLVIKQCPKELLSVINMLVML